MPDNVDIYNLYIQEIPQKILTGVEEKELAKRYHEDGDKEAYDILVTHNLRLVRSIAARFAKYGIDINDLIQAGNLGLLTAVDKFDYTLGYKFSTYAVYWIRRAIALYADTEKYPIKIPVYLLDKYKILLKKADIFFHNEHRYPSLSEMEKMSGIDRKILQKILSVLQYPVLIDGDSHESYMQIYSNEDVSETGTNNILAEMMDKIKRQELSPMEYKVISMRYSDNPKSFEEIGIEICRSKQRAQQIEASALKKLKDNPDIRKIWENA